MNESEEESVCLHYHVSSLAGTPPPPVTVAESLQESLPQESAVEFQQSANVGVHDRSSTYSPTYLPSVADRVADEYTDVVLCRTYYSDSIHIDYDTSYVVCNLTLSVAYKCITLVVIRLNAERFQSH